MNINAVSNRTILRILAVTAGFFATIYVAFVLRHELVLVGISFFLAIAINPLIERWTPRMPRQKRPLAVLLIYFCLLIAIGLMLSAVLPPLVTQTNALAHDLPSYASRLESSNSLAGQLLVQSGVVEKLRTNPNGVLQSLLLSRGNSVLNLVQKFFTSLVSVLTVFTLTLFMLIEGPIWLKRFWQFQDKSKRAHQQKLADEMYQVIAKYVTVNLLFALLAAALVALLLFAFRIPFAIPLAVVVGVLELVPLIGAIIGAVIVGLVCLLNSAFDAAVAMTVFFLVYQHVKGNFLHPLVLGKTIDLSPLLILMSILLGASFAGILGALIAVPVGGCLQILIKDYLASHRRAG